MKIMIRSSASNKGFSAVEVIVVLLVLAVIGGAVYVFMTREPASNSTTPTATVTPTPTTSSSSADVDAEINQIDKLMSEESDLAPDTLNDAEAGL